jgi:hypothetical protein
MNIGTNGFRIIIRGNEHPYPHCHVRWKDGTESYVLIPSLQVLFGKKLTKAVEKMLLDNLDALCDEFDRICPIKEND